MTDAAWSAAVADSPWSAAVAVFATAQQRADEMTEVAAARAASLLASHAVADHHAVRLAMEHVLDGIGGSSGAPSAGGIAEGAAAQRIALMAVLKQSASNASLLGTVAAAVAAHASRHGTAYESVGPSILAAAPLAELVKHVEPSGLPAVLQRHLASCADQRQRLRAIECASNLWASEAQQATAASARALALCLVNVCVDSVLYDPVGKVRLAATRLVADLAVALKPAEVLKLGVLKSRDKDAAIRAVALKICALAGGEEGVASKLSTEEVHQLVLHGSAAAMGDEQRVFARETLLAFLVARQAQPAQALAELRVTEHLELYEPLLATHAEQLYAAAFPDGLGDGGGGAGGVDRATELMPLGVDGEVERDDDADDAHAVDEIEALGGDNHAADEDFEVESIESFDDGEGFDEIEVEDNGVLV